MPNGQAQQTPTFRIGIWLSVDDRGTPTQSGLAPTLLLQERCVGKEKKPRGGELLARDTPALVFFFNWAINFPVFESNVMIYAPSLSHGWSVSIISKIFYSVGRRTTWRHRMLTLAFPDGCGLPGETRSQATFQRA